MKRFIFFILLIVVVILGIKYVYPNLHNQLGLQSGTSGLAAVDANGWSTFTGAQKIYVSSSQGNDANNGLSPSAPVKTLVKGQGLIRSGYGDQLLLKKGDVWSGQYFSGWKKGGVSHSQPTLISSYGTGARPRIESGTATGLSFANATVNHVAIVGIEFKGAGKSNGIGALTTGGMSLTDILIEDVKVSNYDQNISFNHTDYGSVPFHNIQIRRSVSIGAIGHAGIYINDTDGVTIEENVLDHNGWSVGDSESTRPSADPQSHNIYMSANNSNVVVRRNIIANGSSHGIQARSGGDIQQNVFIINPIQGSFGLVNADPDASGHCTVPLHPGGVTGAFKDNVILGKASIHGTGSNPNGWGIEFDNIKSATISGNIFVSNAAGSGSAALIFQASKQSCTPEWGGKSVGVNSNTVVSNNAAYNWTPLSVKSGSPNVSNAFKSGPFSDPNRSVGSYNGTLGGSATYEAFMTKARAQSKDTWDSRYTAIKVVNYVRGGYSFPALSESPLTTGGGGTTPPPSGTPTPSPTPTPTPTPPASGNISIQSNVATFVRDGGSAGTNYGSSPALEAKNSTLGYNRESYIQFDISKLTAVTTVYLRINGWLSDTTSSSVGINVYSTPSTWTESGLTWNNRPSSLKFINGTYITSTSPTSYDIDISDYIKSEIALGHTTISLLLRSITFTSTLATLNSDDTPTPPTLIISGTSGSGTGGTTSTTTDTDGGGKKKH